LLAGGGCVAIGGFLLTLLTIQRRQNWLAVPYVALALAGWFASDPAVSRFGLMGACVLYLALFGAQCLVFAAMTAISFAMRRSSVADSSTASDAEEARNEE
ncbi:MAG: hypothetical protein FWF28_10265, partial [Micrococcales bacterium]|nr:hypothetical protein [Micrococcales bacterium]